MIKFNHDFSSRFRILKGGKVSLVVSALVGSAIIASAAPTGGTVTSGNATISQTGNVTNINQSTQKASINWQGFSINSNETVNFNQPNVNSITLNRVVGNERSVIDGALNANGQVWILNSNGILFNKNAKVNTAGIVATTKDISDADFQAGNYKFSGESKASVVNLGTIEASESGYVALLANTVQNDGTIKAYKGTVHLTGASEATINLNGNSIVSLTVNKGVLDALVENKGAVIADGGKIYLTTNAVDEILKGVVNNTGILEANSMDDVTGHVEVFAHGGMANVSGEIKAEGGFVETSGKNVKIADDVKISTKSKTGKTGTWLIDPTDFTISSGDATQTTSGIGATTLSTQASSNNITIQTQSTGTESGDINVNADVTWSTNKLTLEAHGNININANLKANNNASLDMKTGYNGSTYDTTKSVLVGMNADGTYKGKVSFYTDAGTTARGGTGFLSINGNNYTVITALGSSPTDSTVGKLSAVGTSGYYALGADIDASATAGNNTTWRYTYYSSYYGYGFRPIGSSTSIAFSGNFNGLGHIIDKLYISHPSYNPFYLQSTGLFSSTNNASLSNVALTNIDMPSNSVTNVGGLVGNATNTKISNSYVTTATSKTIGGGTNVGGLVGNLSGANSTIKNSWTNATVQGSTAGGLVGTITSSASITNSYAKGNLENGNIQGGLVGSANGAFITDSYASGNVGNNTYYNTMGGLVGSLTGSTISNSYYGGTTINGGLYLGGLFGTYDLASDITNSYYNVSSTIIKGVSGVVTLGGLYTDMYSSWQTGNRVALNASSYFNTVDTDYFELANLDDLKESLAFVHQDGIKYKLTENLDLTTISGWNIARLKGTFDGTGHTLSNLNIDQNFNKDVGIFGKLDNATVSNLTINGATVKGYGNTGTLAGSSSNNSVISAVIVTGTTITGGSDGNIGGLVGLNTTGSTISGSSTAGTLSGTGVNSGGLVGFNNSAATTLTNSSSIYNSSSSVNLNVTASQVGGLVGKNSGSKIDSSNATGNVNFNSSNNTYTTSYQDIGGLVGLNTASSTISNSNASGTVSGNENIGGLVGLHESSSTIENSYATGAVKGTTDVGGLVGQSSSSTITGSSARTNTNTVSVHSSGTNIGGLVGYTLSSTISDSYSEKNVSTNTNSNQIGGLIGYASGTTISNSNASGTVNGGYDVGGLVGWLSNGSKIISGSYYGGTSVSGTRNIGGLVGSDYLDKGNNNNQNSVLHDTTTYISNSFYNADTVNINSGKNVTLGAIYNKQFTDWMSANRFVLVASDRFGTADSNGYYGITASNIEFVLGYAYHDGIKFKVTENIDLSSIAHSDGTSGNLFQWHLAQFGRMGADGASFDGAGFMLSNLNVTQNFNNDIGLFGRVVNAEVKNLNLSNTTISAYSNIGSLVGYNHKGTISGINLSNATVTGTSTTNSSVGGLVGYSKANSTISNINSSLTPLTGTISSSGNYVGGLVGYNESTDISNAHTNVTLSGSGSNFFGGLVGYNTSSNITNSSTTGSLTGTSKNYLGGVVGYNTTNSDISNTTSSFTITGTGNYVGGLVGYNTTNSDITNSSTSGAISGGSYIGGLVGQNTGSGATITGSHSTGAVTGTSYVGGLVGDNSSSAIIDSSYHTTGTVTGTNYVGGLVGQNYNSAIIRNNSYVSNTTITGNSGSTAVGGLVGLNSTSASIADSYVTGATISGTNQVGGLTGENSGTVSISNSYVENSSIVGGRDVGGLVGGKYNPNLTLANNYYNIDSVSINGAEHMTLGGIYNKQFVDWKTGNRTALILDTYFTQKDVNNNYLVNASNIEFLSGFVYKTTADGAKFKLEENIDLSIIDHNDNSSGTADYLTELSLKEFKGTFDGNGKTLSNLNIDQSFNGDIGLFGRAIDASISNLNISNPTLKGYYNIGTLAGYTNRTNVNNVDITNLTITGDSTSPNGKMGGLIGHNTVSTTGTYTLQNSQVSGTINGFGSYIAGLVGHNEKIAISDSSANVAVTSTTGDYVAGLVGYNSLANITNSSAIGNVTATGRNYIGGLIGFNTGVSSTGSLISGSFATGKVIGANYAGGLIGYNTTYSTVNGSYSTGDVEATGYYVGGLIGQNLSNSNIGALSANYATGNVSGTYYVGGLIGQNSNSTVNNSYTGIKTDATITTKAGTVTGTATTGYVGGLIGQNSSGNISSSIASGDVVSAGDYTGGLIGSNSSSTISNSSSSGNVTATNRSYVGGLIGMNSTGAISGTTSTSGNVIGGNYTGGLIGYNNSSTITGATTSGNVLGNQYVGGLVGQNLTNSTITSSSSSGNVTGKNSSNVYQNYVGGLVGFNTNSNITSSNHTTGKVMGLDYVGGLVGQNQGSTTPYTINTSYASGEVEGQRYVGGLVGYSYQNSAITNSYVENGSKVTGTRNVGGLVGMSDTTVTTTYPASITNSYYNVNEVTINSGNYVTLGGIYNKQFTDWMDASTPRTALTASTYLGTADGSGFYTLNKNNIEYALAFANTSGMKFKLGETIDVSDITQSGTTDTKLTDWHLAEFRGTFDGNSKALLNVNINQSFNDEVGVIGRLIGGSITNLGVSGNSIISGYESIGGLVGKNQNSTISGSFSNATVNGVSKAGGLVGHNYQQSTTTSITDSYATGNVGSTSGTHIGGLVGYNQSGTLTRTYATGTVTGATKGGLVGYNSGIINNSLYNSTSTGTVTGGTAKTLTELKSLATYTTAGWTNISDVGASGKTWRIYEGNTSPLLTSYLTALSGTISNTPLSKVYDGNAQIEGTINWASTPTNSLVLGTPTITVSSKNVGEYTNNTINGVYSSQLGYDFSVDGTIPTVEITAKELSATLTGTIIKEYDGSTDATLSSTNYDLTGFITGEGASVSETSGIYNSKNVINANSVTATLGSDDFTANSGTLLSNYILPTNASGTASITAKELSATLTGTITKEYDGSTDATLSSSNYDLTGFITGEGASVSETSGIYNSKNVINANSVTATLGLDDFTVDIGTQLSNYVLPTTANGTAEITKKVLTISGTTASNKIYDGTIDVSETLGTLDGFVGTETVDSSAVGIFDSKDAGTRTATFVYTLADGTNGGLANNYLLANTTDEAEITKKVLTISGTTASNKIYDGTIDVSETLGTLDGFVGTETVDSSAVGIFDSKDAGTRTATFVYTLADGTNGGLANNYLLANTTDEA
ncbi:MAG: GLUG motif-containing protein, partial [Aliarcobacter sp.]|nr:GLUG motif-containing protein [Aliarcobacter sp.]